MKQLYIDCSSGAAGDMLTAALLGLFEDPQVEVDKLNHMGLPGIQYNLEKMMSYGIEGYHMQVTYHGEEEGEHEHNHDHTHDHHSHATLHGIQHIIEDHLSASTKVKQDFLHIYQLIAEAESKVHGESVEEIHFHEVGAMDAVADITAVCQLLEDLGIEEVLASPIHVGRGFVKCAHGLLPIPAPATANLLMGIPIYSKEEVEGELCTPTGAALLKHFVSKFETLPTLTIQKIGIGIGKKDFGIPNCLRVMLAKKEKTDEIIELECNVDDMRAEEIGYCTEVLLENGARDVFTIPVQMKKNRPGTLLVVVTDETHLEMMRTLLFKHTTTIGIRQSRKERYVLDRSMKELQTSLGTIHEKISTGYGVTKKKYEYEDLSNIAKKTNQSIEEVKQILQKELNNESTKN